MPEIIFKMDEIEESEKSKVNKSGYAYVGRKHAGKEVTWIKLKSA